MPARWALDLWSLNRSRQRWTELFRHPLGKVFQSTQVILPLLTSPFVSKYIINRWGDWGWTLIPHPRSPALVAANEPRSSGLQASAINLSAICLLGITPSGGLLLTHCLDNPCREKENSPGRREGWERHRKEVFSRTGEHVVGCPPGRDEAMDIQPFNIFWVYFWQRLLCSGRSKSFLPHCGLSGLYELTWRPTLHPNTASGGTCVLIPTPHLQLTWEHNSFLSWDLPVDEKVSRHQVDVINYQRSMETTRQWVEETKKGSYRCLESGVSLEAEEVWGQLWNVGGVPSYTAGGNVNWCSHYGEQHGGTFKN